ncbi:MAG: type II toxin-antitoxin system RelE/ParE family toxin [Lachnospiraceae bacterium]|jgi:mRNA interferase RelE/StbE|nr:type II toxin-antitoxin system RelE/ParE family toxin [Lachnospiraceae bacterium]
MFEVKYTNTAERYLKKIKDKQLLAKYKTAIDKLRHDPFIGTQKSGDLRGIYAYDVKYGGISHEIAYRIYEESNQLIVILLVGTRENFYHELKRMLK